MVHAVRKKLGTHFLDQELYTKVWNGWKRLDTIHLLLNHRYYMDPESTIKEFDLDNISSYNYTFGIIARDILNRSGLLRNINS